MQAGLLAGRMVRVKQKCVGAFYDPFAVRLPDFDRDFGLSVTAQPSICF
ncbi:hypothetical protein JK169_14425 [Acetobacter persici]|nr:hypothetical protein [Acetobacter persici]MBS1002175.1 hypothetical protein [Acetobacter persici]